MENAETEFGKRVGENIRKLREGNHETQAQLADFIGYGTTTIANYESGIRLPDIETAYRIAKHYHVSLDELVTERISVR